jgi:signal transduction histidine kinase
MSQQVREILQERQEGLIQTQATLSNLVIATLAVAVIFALLMGITLTRSVTRPVSRLSEITKKMAAGDLTQRAKVTSRDELGELAISFNQMTESLQKSRDEIQGKNQELEAMNEELRASNEELQATEEEVRATNEELQSANDELRQAQDRLIRSEKLAAIGQLASGVGHELRNPLGAIKNAVFYVRRKVAKTDLPTAEPRVPEFLDIIDEEVNTANKVISDLLGFSRVAKPTVSPVSLAGLVEDVLKSTPLPENVDLTKDIDENLPMVMVDADQIRQVLVNIILNAQQAMTDGGRLDIRANGKGGFVEVEFADTGSGIPESAINKIFDPLFTTKAKGIGLGLSVSKSILERHGGDIQVESEVDKGTKFTVFLPTQKSSLVDTEQKGGNNENQYPSG